MKSQAVLPTLTLLALSLAGCSGSVLFDKHFPKDQPRSDARPYVARKAAVAVPAPGPAVPQAAAMSLNIESGSALDREDILNILFPDHHINSFDLKPTTLLDIRAVLVGVDAPEGVEQRSNEAFARIPTFTVELRNERNEVVARRGFGSEGTAHLAHQGEQDILRAALKSTDDKSLMMKLELYRPHVSEANASAYAQTPWNVGSLELNRRNRGVKIGVVSGLFLLP